MISAFIRIFKSLSHAYPAGPIASALMTSRQAPSPSSSDRVAWVDYAKGLCIMLVVMMHTVNGVESFFSAEGWLRPVVDFAKPFRMPDFFLISGLFLSRTLYGPVTDYIDRKLVHFIYFYVIWVTLQLVVLKLPLFLAAPDQFLLLYLKSFVTPVNSLWFVHMLAIFYVFTWLTRRVPMLVMLTGAFALQSLYQLNLIDTGWTVADRFANRYVYFYIGFACAPWIFDFAHRARGHAVPAIAGLVVWAVANWWAVQQGWHQIFLISFVLGMAGATALCVISSFFTKFSWTSFFKYCGRNSIVIYLTFPFPLAAAKYILAQCGAPLESVGLASFLTLMFAVLAPLIFYEAIKGTALRGLYVRPPFVKLPDALNRTLQNRLKWAA